MTKLTPIIVPYKQGSRSARSLARELDGKVVILDIFRSRFHFSPEKHLLINWGSTEPPDHIPWPLLVNSPFAVREATCKLTFFQRACEAGLEHLIPPFWTNKEDIPDEAFPILCRTILNGHSGRGIVVANSHDDLVDAALFTQYLKKKREFRIHLGIDPETRQKSITISVQEKKKRRDADEVNWQIRNHENGFIYARQGVEPPEAVMEVAHRIFLEASDLDFGAVDVIYNERNDKAYALEINTAPGLEGQTVKDYADFFNKVREEAENRRQRIPQLIL